MRKNAKLLRNFADDLLYALGCCLILIGTYHLAPVATWFVAGAMCLVTAYFWAKFWEKFIESEEGQA